MNEQTTQLVRELAEKLGTTTEHLWGVLVRQAPITATADLVWSTGIVIVTIYSGRWVLAKTKRFLERDKQAAEKDRYSCDPPIGFLLSAGMWFVWGLVAFFALSFVAGGVSSTLAGFFNPEYWALKQIIK